MYWRSSIPTFTSSQCSSSHRPNATSIIFSYQFFISIAMIVLRQNDPFLIVKFFQHLSIDEVFSFYSRATFLPLLREWGLCCSTSDPHRTINLLLILQLGFASRSHLMLPVGMKTNWRISHFTLQVGTCLFEACGLILYVVKLLISLEKDWKSSLRFRMLITNATELRIFLLYDGNAG